MTTAHAITISCALAVIALAACAQPPPSEPPAGAAPGLAVSLRTDKITYGPKDPIKFTLTAKNTSKSPIKLTFASGKRCDFEIHKGPAASGDKLWQWSRGRMFPMIVIQTTVDPGKQLEYSETFTPGEKLPDGRPGITLAAGPYTATSVLETSIGRVVRPSSQAHFAVK